MTTSTRPRSRRFFKNTVHISDGEALEFYPDERVSIINARRRKQLSREEARRLWNQLDPELTKTLGMTEAYTRVILRRGIRYQRRIDEDTTITDFLDVSDAARNDGWQDVMQAAILNAFEAGKPHDVNTIASAIRAEARDVGRPRRHTFNYRGERYKATMAPTPIDDGATYIVDDSLPTDGSDYTHREFIEFLNELQPHERAVLEKRLKNLDSRPEDVDPLTSNERRILRSLAPRAQHLRPIYWTHVREARKRADEARHALIALEPPTSFVPDDAPSRSDPQIKHVAAERPMHLSVPETLQATTRRQAVKRINGRLVTAVKPTIAPAVEHLDDLWREDVTPEELAHESGRPVRIGRRQSAHKAEQEERPALRELDDNESIAASVDLEDTTTPDPLYRRPNRVRDFWERWRNIRGLDTSAALKEKAALYALSDTIHVPLANKQQTLLRTLLSKRVREELETAYNHWRQQQQLAT